MFKKETHKLATAFRGTVHEMMSAGYGTPYADPRLPVIQVLGFAPEGLDVVSREGVAVGINEQGYLVPCDGVVKPYGIAAFPLLGTACLFEGVVPGDFTSVPSLTNGAFTGTETLHQLIPSVYQGHALFENGLAYKADGASKGLFEYAQGDVLRPITKEEINAAVADETLPILFAGENKVTCPKTKAYYAGMLVKFGATLEGVTPETANSLEMKCARVAAFRNPAYYDQYAYSGQWCFDYDMQGKNTAGNSRAVWNAIGKVYGNPEYVTKIVDFYVTM